MYPMQWMFLINPLRSTKEIHRVKTLEYK